MTKLEHVALLIAAADAGAHLGITIGGWWPVGIGVVVAAGSYAWRRWAGPWIKRTL